MSLRLDTIPLIEFKHSRLSLFSITCKVNRNNTKDVFHLCEEDQQMREMTYTDRHAYLTEEYKRLKAISTFKQNYLRSVRNILVVAKDYKLVKDFIISYISDPLINIDLCNSGINCTIDSSFPEVTIDANLEIIMTDDSHTTNHLYNISYKANASNRSYITNGSVGVVAPTLEKALEAFKNDSRYSNYNVINITHRGQVNIVTID